MEIKKRKLLWLVKTTTTKKITARSPNLRVTPRKEYDKKQRGKNRQNKTGF